MNKETEEVNKETEEIKEVKEAKNEETQKSSKSFTETISGIWNSRPVRFIRKVTKWTLITGGALLGVTAAAQTGTELALEKHDAKMNGDSDSDSEIPDEIPGDSEEVPNETVDSDSESES